MTLTDNTTFMAQIRKYLDRKEYGEPILLADVVLDFTDENKNSKKLKNTISAYLNRLTKNNELKKFSNGVFYKTKRNIFGETPINYANLIEKTYLYDVINENRIGYRIGPNVLVNIGITNNLENAIEIVTNNFNKGKVVGAINQNIKLRKPNVRLTNDNFLYLQLLDTIKDINNYHITNEQVGPKLVNYMEENGIKLDKLFKIAKAHYNTKTINNLVDLLAM